jgi:hypothetical protein
MRRLCLSLSQKPTMMLRDETKARLPALVSDRRVEDAAYIAM